MKNLENRLNSIEKAIIKLAELHDYTENRNLTEEERKKRYNNKNFKTRKNLIIEILNN